MAFFWVRHFHPGGSSFPPRLTGLEWRAFFINNSKTMKGIRLIFSGLIEVHKVYLQCKAWLSSYCSFCVILNSTKVRHLRPGRRFIYTYNIPIAIKTKSQEGYLQALQQSAMNPIAYWVIIWKLLWLKNDGYSLFQTLKQCWILAGCIKFC